MLVGGSGASLVNAAQRLAHRLSEADTEARGRLVTGHSPHDLNATLNLLSEVQQNRAPAVLSVPEYADIRFVGGNLSAIRPQKVLRSGNATFGKHNPCRSDVFTHKLSVLTLNTLSFLNTGHLSGSQGRRPQQRTKHKYLL